MSEPDNPRAFPVPTAAQHGMTLRDWFAGKVAPAAFTYALDRATDGRATNLAAEIAYAFADAMLEQRKRG